MQVRDELRVLVEAEVARAIENFEKLNGKLDDVDGKAKNASANIDGIGKALGGLAEIAALTAALSAIKDMGAFALQTADNFQTAKNQFGVLLGDMQAGAGLFNEVKAFNDKTPFDLGTLTQATNVLIAAKVPLKDLQTQLTKFGDLSQGSSQKFTGFVNALSKAAARGKADMEVLNVYLNQGIPILDELARGFGVTAAEVADMTGKGQISFNDFSKALDDLAAAGGQYFGGMELGSKSLAAMQEGLRESVNSLAASFGDMLLPAANGVVGSLTNITNAINNSPIAKGVFAGALITLNGYMATMAVKAMVAFAAQMKLNLAVGALNPTVLAVTIAAGALAAGYTIMAADAQKAARETENLALAQQKQKTATQEGVTAVQAYYQASQGFSLEATIREIEALSTAVEEQKKRGVVSSEEMTNLRSVAEQFGKLRAAFIKDFYDASSSDKIKELNNRISIAQDLLLHVEISAEDKSALEDIISMFQKEINKLAGGIDEKAGKWKEDWSEVWNKFQADQARDPFYAIELERKKKLEDAWNNYVRTGNQTVIDQVNAYYDTQRGEVIKHLGDEEARIQRELSRTKSDDLEYELQQALEAIDTLEAQRVIAAGNSEEAIQEIRERYTAMRGETETQYRIKIDKSELEEAREAVKDWQQELSDSLTQHLMNTRKYSEQMAVVIGDLTAQLAALSASATLSGFEELGRALGKGADGAESMKSALVAMHQEILNALPNMFLQAGLQLIIGGNWPLGLGFIAAAGATALIKGYVNGRIEQETGAGEAEQAVIANAYGNAFDINGIKAFARGGTFTNQVVNQPTLFQFARGTGLMGEAGPEAIMPLKRMPSGNLGVEASGGGGSQVIVNIINHTGAELSREQKTGADGNTQIDVIIGALVDRHIASGKADRVMGGRFGLRAMGV